MAQKRRRKKFTVIDTTEKKERRIKSKSWRKYTDALRRLSDEASEKLTKYILEGHSEKEILDYAYAIVSMYGEASSELACQMVEALAEYSNAAIEAAEPAATATYGDTARAVRSEMMRTKDAVTIGSTAGRLVKLASADTMAKNAIRDGAQWAWIPSGDSCAFCMTLASRGWQFASEDMLWNGHAEHIHNHCDCNFCVRYSNDVDVEGYDPENLYEEYMSAGATRMERINALRRQNYEGNREKINAQKREAYRRRKAQEAAGKEQQ